MSIEWPCRGRERSGQVPWCSRNSPRTILPKNRHGRNAEAAGGEPGNERNRFWFECVPIRPERLASLAWLPYCPKRIDQAPAVERIKAGDPEINRACLKFGLHFVRVADAVHPDRIAEARVGSRRDRKSTRLNSSH